MKLLICHDYNCTTAAPMEVGHRDTYETVVVVVFEHKRKHSLFFGWRKGYLAERDTSERKLLTASVSFKVNLALETLLSGVPTIILIP